MNDLRYWQIYSQIIHSQQHPLARAPLATVVTLLVGTTLDLSANPRDASEPRASGVLEESDVGAYRTLLAESDDMSDGGAEIVHLAQAR